MKYLFDNWKSYLDYKETLALATTLALTPPQNDRLTVAIFPFTPAVSEVIKISEGTPLHLGAQDIEAVSKGAYTGAVSAQVFQELGCTYALVGHSERRQLFSETPEIVRDKFLAALDSGIIPVLCIGETKEIREIGTQVTYLKDQLKETLAGVVLDESKPFIVAYEPVWAIGTGEACDDQEAAAMQAIIKQELTLYTAAEVPVLYGGSVSEKNVVSYVSHDTIDGVLVGKASTEAISMMGIIRLLEQIV